MNKSEIRYIKGDATKPQGDGQKIIVHCCNNIGGWGKGFVLALSKHWPHLEDSYRKWHRSKNDFELGSVQFIHVAPDVVVANLIGQSGITWENGIPPVRYEAIKAGLKKVHDKALQIHASVHMPRMGCGLAGGEWSKMEPIIEETLGSKGIGVTVYDF